jgi:N-formylglutamate amidohydrolase
MITEMIVTPLLIDCHSFSSRPNLLNRNPPNIDICIGYNDDATCPDKVVIGNIVQHFKSLGYKVGINEPFSNSKTFEVPVEYHSVMIEVNKRLYMDEQTLEKTDGIYTLKQDIQSLYPKLLK